MFLRQNHRTTIHRIQRLHIRNALRARWVSSAHNALVGNRKGAASKPDSPSSAVSNHGSRTLATAVADTSLFASQSFDPLVSSMPSSSSRPLSPTSPTFIQPFYYLRPFDVSNPLQIPLAPPTLPRTRITAQGMSGDVEELVAVFDACIQVQKLERAQLVLKRLAKFDQFPRHQLLAMHNAYLRASLDEMCQEPGSNVTDALHKWYELQIRKPGLPQTPETLACMLKASLLSQSGAALDRSVQRYMGMAPGEAGLEVLAMADILSDQDVVTITEICPAYNLVPNEEVDGAPTDDASANPSQETRGLPELLATPQKGISLQTVQQTLSLFDEMPQGFDLSTLSPNELREIQSRLERDCVDAAVHRWREEHDHLRKLGLNTTLNHHSLAARMYNWQQELEAKLSVELRKVEEAENMPRKGEPELERCVYGPFLRQSTPSRLAAIAILSVMNAISVLGVEKGAKLSTAITSVAKHLEEDIRLENARKNRPTKTSLNGNGVVNRSGDRRRVVMAASGPRDSSHQETADGIMPRPEHNDAASIYSDPAWPLVIRAKVGAVLVSALMETAKIEVFRQDPTTKQTISQWQRAFHHNVKLIKGKKVGMILIHDELVASLKKEPQANFMAKHLPMVVEPLPWTKFAQGAFVDTPAALVRLKLGEREQKVYTEAALARGDIDQVLKGLDVLGRTAWRINNPVLEVMVQAWNEGREIAAIPAANPDIEYPPEPEDLNDRTSRAAWHRAVTAADNKKSGNHSMRCFTNLQLEVARAYRNQIFYFPHNIDFRGRAYPLPTYLNHMGADNVRGLLRFAHGKELGDRGLRWLKIHLANVYGLGKASLSERVAFTDANVDNIMDSANKPLDGKSWWLGAEDPWQTLAACFELKGALECPDPTKFVSTLPVHQDGTCNGLQHYAALGGDVWGAQQVNLEPGDRPADVYTAVAELVSGLVDKDAETGHPIAEAVQGKVSRKVVKPTVMTNVYGVTFSGAKKQVAKQLQAAYPKLDQESGYPFYLLSSYITRHIFQAMSTMFRGAHNIQSWLGEVGGRICTSLHPEQIEQMRDDPESLQPAPASRQVVRLSKRRVIKDIADHFKSTIVWTTPLRMPVAQPYKRRAARLIRTCLQDLKLQFPDTSDPVHRRKQLQAFPPNFIHSLDASHMLLSALQCNEAGLTFAAVHDSFWTHAADVDHMNSILRDCFVRIHSEDVMGRLAAEFEARYGGSLYLARFKRSSALGKKFATWRNTCTTHMTQLDELLVEYERQQLLHSSDPAQIQTGKTMVTPASIYEEFMQKRSREKAGVENEVDLGQMAPVEERSALSDEADDAEQGAEDFVEPYAELEEEEEEDEQYADWVERTLRGTQERPKFTVNETGPKRRPRATPKVIDVWLPLSFPPVPQKGTFDVERLKASQYFFS